MKLAQDGASDATIVLSERQTKARGRQGRPWSTTNNSIALSYIKRFNRSGATRLTLFAGQALVESFKQLGVRTQIKWPNDIWIAGGLKVAGILTEASTTGNTIDAVIIGIGINVSRTLVDDPAIGFLSDEGFDGDKELVLQSVIDSLELYLRDPNDDELFARCLAHHREHSAILGKEVATHNATGNLIRAHAVNLDNRGALVVKDENDNWATINSGEVILAQASS
jgi:BirA family biotin operon repressor/biotin-[acetyl-CoA-carboxylase] ligase